MKLKIILFTLLVLFITGCGMTQEEKLLNQCSSDEATYAIEEIIKIANEEYGVSFDIYELEQENYELLNKCYQNYRDYYKEHQQKLLNEKKYEEVIEFDKNMADNVKRVFGALNDENYIEYVVPVIEEASRNILKETIESENYEEAYNYIVDLYIPTSDLQKNITLNYAKQLINEDNTIKAYFIMQKYKFLGFNNEEQELYDNTKYFKLFKDSSSGHWSYFETNGFNSYSVYAIFTEDNFEIKTSNGGSFGTTSWTDDKNTITGEYKIVDDYIYILNNGNWHKSFHLKINESNIVLKNLSNNTSITLH